MINVATVVALVIGILVGMVITAVIGMVMLSKDMFTMNERLNNLYNQNTSVISNLNNPAVSGLMTHVSQQEREVGFDAGLNLAILCLHRMYDKDGMLVGDFDQLSDQMRSHLDELLNDQKKYEKAHTKLEDYYAKKQKEEGDEDDESDD